MSIVRMGSMFVPVCDYCDDSLPAECTFYDAVGAVKSAGWKAIKNTRGDWSDACPDCYTEIHEQIGSAASDFEGIGRA